MIQMGIGGIKRGAHWPRIGYMSGGSSTRKVARPTATGTRGLTPKRSVSGGIVRPPTVRVQDGHITVRVTPSQAVSDLLVKALGQGKD